MKLISLKQYMKMSKPALIRKITKTLRAMPKVKLARLCYNITKAKLPRVYLSTKKRQRRIDYISPTPKGLVRRPGTMQYAVKRKKRKFSPKQLAAQRLFAKRARAGTLKRRRR